MQFKLSHKVENTRNAYLHFPTMNQITEHVRAHDVKWLSLLVKEKGSEHLRKTRDVHKNSTILIASQLGATEVVEYCIFIGCSVDDINIAGDTPMIMAAKHGHFEVIQLVRRRINFSWLHKGQ